MTYRFASLSAGLLARKGAAAPAMATHAGGNPRLEMPPPEPVAPPAEFAWPPPKAMFQRAAEAPPAPPHAPPPSPCLASAACSVSGEASADPSRRFHVSVRLKQSHFVRLKIASALLKKPGQDIVAEALSAYFATMEPGFFGDCACARD
jgi:hypothetical protein